VAINDVTKYIFLGLDILGSATCTSLGLRCIASTITYETVALLTNDVVSLVKVKRLTLRAIAYFTIALLFFLLSIKITLADYVSRIGGE